MSLQRVLAATVIALSLACAAPARADSWIFGNSYYTHTPAAPVQIGPRAVGGPYYTRQRGEYVRSVQRWSYSPIIVGGGIYDNLMIRSGWIQYGAQY